MRKMKLGILVLVAVLALVSVASGALLGDVQATETHPYGSIAYWKVDVLASTASQLPVANGYPGWCVDIGNGTSSGSTHWFKAYSSLDPTTLPAGIPTIDWKAINYILNVAPSNGDWKIKQAAMWHYDGMSGSPYPEHDVVAGYDHGVYDAYISQINANKGTFNPKCGQLYAIVLYYRGQQVVITEGKTKDCENTPEFPTLALPVAMLIGVVGAVQFIRSKKE